MFKCSIVFSKLFAEEDCMVNFQMCRHHPNDYGTGYQRDYRIDYPLSYSSRDKEVT